MLKKLTKSAIFSSLTLGLLAIANQVAFAASNCSVNGKEVDCAVIGNQIKSFFGWGIGGFLVLIVLGTLATVFWIMMIVHAAQHDIENRAMWIVIMVFTGIIGAIVYYFVVKRKFAKHLSLPKIT